MRLSSGWAALFLRRSLLNRVYVDGSGSGITCGAIEHAVAEHGFRRLLWKAAPIRCHGLPEKASLISCIFSWCLFLQGDGKAGLNFKPPPMLAAAIRANPEVCSLRDGEVLSIARRARE